MVVNVSADAARASADGLRECDHFDARNDCSNEMGGRAYSEMAELRRKDLFSSLDGDTPFEHDLARAAEDVIDKGMELAKSPNYETDEAVLEYWDEFMAHVEGFNEKQKK